MSGRVQNRLQELGIVLPAAAAPAANYRPWVLSGSQLYISGQLPMQDGKVALTGRVGEELSIEQGVEAAWICGLNILAQALAATGNLDRVAQCNRLEGFVNSAAGFEAQPAVINGASDLMAAVLGEAKGHARFAVGASSLPFNAAVEVAASFEIS